MWKFVDDVSSSENLTSNSHSATQSTLHNISSWTSNNCMKLNAKKCKKLRICFHKGPLRKRHSYHLEQSTVTRNGTIPQSLGLIIQNNLKWGEQIFSTITKASKRLYALRVLSRGGVPLLTSSMYTMRFFVLFWNTAAGCGIMPCRAICRTNWKRCKIVQCVLFPWSFI